MAKPAKAAKAAAPKVAEAAPKAPKAAAAGRKGKGKGKEPMMLLADMADPYARNFKPRR